MSRELSVSKCVICRTNITNDCDVATVGRGLNSLIQFSLQYNDIELHEYLLSKPSVVKVHSKCRNNYTSKRKLELALKRSADQIDEQVVEPKLLRSTAMSFDWKINCIFCGDLCVKDARHPDRCDHRRVETIHIKNTVLDMCKQRLLNSQVDDLARTVQHRLLSCCDLVAAEAVYHRKCHNKFFKVIVRDSIGRPIDEVKDDAFDKICDWLEVTDLELITLQDVIEKALSLTGSNDCEKVYTTTWLKTRLLERYEGHIMFAEVKGRRDVICWSGMANYIVNTKWYESRKEKIEDDSERIVATAAKLLKSSIREAHYEKDVYPTCDDIASIEAGKRWMPALLNVFLDNLVSSDVKKIAIGNSIVQAVRPKTVIAPVIFGAGISVDHVCGSKQLINLLYHLGFSMSYDELLRYKQSAVQSDIVQPASHFPEYFTQFAADNVDHNFCTIDGLNTLHAMAIMSMSTSIISAVFARGSTFGDTPIVRLPRKKVADVMRNQGIPLLPYDYPEKSALSLLCFNQWDDLKAYLLQPVATKQDVLWQIGWFASDEMNYRPGWSGFMHDINAVRSGNASLVSTVTLHPIIDRNPNDHSTIYTTLIYVSQQSQNLHVPTACITFDHPLWLKAVDIVYSKQLKIVCRLGPFHMLMSFLGSIGSIMKGSGLAEALECCYGPNAVSVMMDGKAVKRALRGHFLMSSALNIILLRTILKVPGYEDKFMISSDFALTEDDIIELKAVYNEVFNLERDGLSLSSVESLGKLSSSLQELKDKLISTSRTAKLWLQYDKYVDIVKLFIRAERTGDWALHLSTVAKMLNLFAATGHANYAKSGRLYLEMMLRLPTDHPWLHEQFMDNGFHVIRSSNRFWTGMSSDLAIETKMMKPVKGKSGLTHGRGISESVRTTWVKTVHKCATVHTAMLTLTDLVQSADEVHHEDSSKSKAKRDFTDTTKLLQWLEACNPFDTVDTRLRSLTTGVSASETNLVNCDNAEDVGAAIMQHMSGLPYCDVTIKKADKVVNLSQVGTIAVPKAKGINIDGAVLFSRLLIIMSRCSNIAGYFAYELTASPSSLFKDTFMRKPEKAMLKHELIKEVDSIPSLPDNCYYVLDGGNLLHRVKWLKGVPYFDVIQQYVNYVQKHFGSKAVIVFDGYCNGANTKNHEHQRRAAASAPDIVFDSSRTVFHDQSAFLSNERNKKQFVDFLIASLEQAGFKVHQAKDDADTLIVKTALELATLNQPVTVVANDTDILVILVYHYNLKLSALSPIYLKSDIKRQKTDSKSVISIRDVCLQVGDSTARALLAIHAISGCDTTSAMFGHGKTSALKVLTKCNDITRLAHLLGCESLEQSEVVNAGLQLIAVMYGGKVSDDLNLMRYSMYCHLTSTATRAVLPERLPPTVKAAKFHILRTHLQVLQWKSLMSCKADPEQWGWKLSDDTYIPIATDIEAAPSDILNFVRCKCSTTSRQPCGMAHCSCRKHGLECVSACKHCHGTSCENAATVDSDTLNMSDADDNVLRVDHVESLPEEEVDDNLEYFIPWVNEEIVIDI